MRVLVLHNRYRVQGGEERAVELHVEALRQAGVTHRELVRDSAETGRVRAAGAMLRGGDESDEVARAARDLGATVVHAHNMQPLFGPRSLAAAREEGAKVVLHLHNFRLFCAIGVSFRLGQPCFRCHHGRTVPGLVLNCRDSFPEAAVYAAAPMLMKGNRTKAMAERGDQRCRSSAIRASRPAAETTRQVRTTGGASRP